MSCDAAIRPFPVGNETEVRCELLDGVHVFHRGRVLDYAYPGSETVVEWHEDDRRCFHGEWPGHCGKSTDDGWCELPAGHGGSCAA